jgi:hypothetical protein
MEDDDVVTAEPGGSRGVEEAGALVTQAAHPERVPLAPIECQHLVGRQEARLH